VQKPRILHVDDDNMFHLLMDGMLGAYCDIDSVYSVDEAVEYLQEHSVDLIFTDLMMPIKPGTVLIHYCQQSESLQDVPVIALSATGDARLIEEARQLGADMCLGKPFGRLDLLAAIDAMLEQSLRDT
jgi:CheY-like chemotaxis protein